MSRKRSYFSSVSENLSKIFRTSRSRNIFALVVVKELLFSYAAGPETVIADLVIVDSVITGSKLNRRFSEIV